MRKKIFFSWLTIIFVLLGYARLGAQTYWQQQVNYDISVSLNDSNQTLDGSLQMEYINHSPDSLPFIWIHLWPNAYKNDKTAFSEQKLLGNQQDFYFSSNSQKGYINRLDFKVAGVSVLMEDHPQYIDIVKLILPKPLAPGSSLNISTSFHVKIPDLFSRMGHFGQYYNITQWYPKAAVYDAAGWHPMPYLEWGEYYNDFGNYSVHITLPANYVVAATGVLQNEAEKNWLLTRTKAIETPRPVAQKKELFPTKKKHITGIPSSTDNKTLHYVAENVTDFAWFADKRFIVKHDTIQLGDRVVDAWNYVLPADTANWKNSMQFTKNAVHFYSAEIGDYPYPQVSIVCNAAAQEDGMEYPMISTLNAGGNDDRLLDMIIAHEVGHNWFQAVLSNNERDHAWMDEGMNTFYEKKYERLYYSESGKPKKFLQKKLPEDDYELMMNEGFSNHSDQPIETVADQFGMLNYYASSYAKAALWLEKLEAERGRDAMKKIMQQYFIQWKFKHPQPGDFKKIAEENCGCSLDDHFKLLHERGPLPKPAIKKDTRVTGFFNFKDRDKHNYIALAPAIGFNNYDKLELGLLIHNYTVPSHHFQYAIAPMFATGSKNLVGVGRISYDWFPKNNFQKIQLYASASHFNTDDGLGLNDEKLFKGFSKFVPGIYAEWKPKNSLSTKKHWVDFRTFFIGEQQFEQLQRPAPADSLYYDHKAGTETTVIPQLTLGWANERSLYPWSVELSFQQVKQIVRSTVVAKYFLNYNDKGQGISVRFFAGKIVYTKTKTDLLRAQNSRYHFTMYGPNGFQDYTYSNIFAERNQSPQLLGRQIMIRDGGFKYRSDYSSVQPGLKTTSIDFFDNWMAAANFEIDLPDKVNPLSLVNIPLKVFTDLGTSASPWTVGSDQPKFLYSIGLQVRLFRILNVYYPIVQSKEFKEPNSVNDPNKPGGPSWWQKRLTFSLDIQKLKQLAQNALVL